MTNSIQPNETSHLWINTVATGLCFGLQCWRCLAEQAYFTLNGSVRICLKYLPRIQGGGGLSTFVLKGHNLKRKAARTEKKVKYVI